MEIPPGGTYLTSIHGTRVLVEHSTPFDPLKHRGIHVFDFSRRGSAALLLSDGNDGGTERRAAFERGRSRTFVRGDGIGPRWDKALGDNIVSCVVSSISYSTVEGAVD